jgi:GTP cyclohydrolase I
VNSKKMSITNKDGYMIDKEKIKEAIRLLLEGIGEDPDREGLVETPDRIARMCEEIYGGMYEDAAEHLKKRFSSKNSEMVIEQDITFYSMCEHHMLPFYGKAHIAYIPDGEVVGISKLARTLDVFARRLQIQEHLTDQVADAIMNELHPKGVAVMIEAEHMCMTMRGIKKPGSSTVTLARRGVFAHDQALLNEFLDLLRFHR